MSLAGYISPRELKDLLISLAALVIAFSVLIGGRSIPGLEMILTIALGVGTGFILHEMAHKFVALRFGYMAEYRANMTGLLLAVVLSFAGFIFAAPGAVMIRKPRLPEEFYGREPWGQARLAAQLRNESLRISLAGPLTNIVLCGVLCFAALKPIGRRGRPCGKLRSYDQSHPGSFQFASLRAIRRQKDIR